MTTDIEITAEMPVEIPMPPIKPGADFDWVLEVWDDNDVPVDTTDYAFTVTGKDKINGAEVFSLSIDNGITHTPALGKFAVHIDGAVTATYKMRKIVWDSFLTTDTGEILPPLQGIENPIEVLPRIG